MFKSICCKAIVDTFGTDEGTMYYVCSKCKKPCDVKKVKMTKAKFKKLIKLIKKEY